MAADRRRSSVPVARDGPELPRHWTDQGDDAEATVEECPHLFVLRRRVEVRHEARPVAVHDRVWARGMTITDPVHVAAAKVLREQFQRPRPAPDPHDGLLRDLAGYDRAFGLIDGGLTADSADGEEVA